MIDEQQFKLLCDRALESLNKSLASAADRFGFDADMNNGTLTIDFDEPKARFVVSPQTPVRQIWVSAQSRSFKLDWDGAEFSLPGGKTLRGLIAERISEQVGEQVEL
jgi:iron donor protein CyaY